MSETCNIPHPLKREGTTQHERFPAALSPSYVQVDEHTVPELVRLSHAYAKYVYFFPSDGSATTNWQVFFEEIKQLADNPANYRNNVFDFSLLESLSQTKPHIALFLAFLRLFGFAQDNLNELGGRHLDFYYKEILRLKERDAVPDRVALFFQLEKNVPEKKLDAGTLFKAGKDNTGKERYYRLAEDMLVNTATIRSVKTLLVKRDETGKTTSLHAQTGDPAAETPWVTFGEEEHPHADMGFMLSSPALELAEGNRVITINLSGLPKLTPGSLTAEYTAAKEWAPVTSVVTEAGKIIITLNDQCAPAAAYNATVHKGNYNTADPLLKIMLAKSEPVAAPGTTNAIYDALKNISPAGSNFSVSISVSGVRNMIVENDNGTLEAAKPFLPFGGTPVTGSEFYVGYPLAFNKYLRQFNLKYTLQQPVAEELIYSYAAVNNISFSAKEMMLGRPDRNRFSFNDPGADAQMQSRLVNTINDVAGYVNTYSFADVYYLGNRNWQPLNTKATRNGVFVPQTGVFTNNIQKEVTGLAPGIEGSFIRLSLTDEQLDYDKYVKRLTAAITAGTTPPDKPAVPKISDLSLDYTLQLGLADVRYFHLHPFGFEEISGNVQNTIPFFSHEGNLYIGMADLDLPGVLNIYFQVQEDSGDVNQTIRKVEWYSLKGNRWTRLEPQQILRDSTRNLTQSGIISFNLITETTDTTHQVFDNGLVWLRASVPDNSAAHPKMIGIRSQAGIAIFENRENDPEHLRHPLPPGSITKFLEKPDGVKSVAQPFESFGGKMKEESRHFYTRVSERLRHKQRAWTIWDYERIILENFPFVYKVKCIPHTTSATEYAPGHGTIIVIPSLVNTATYNRLEPRISVGNLEKISEFVNRYCSTFAKIKVINPEYEKIRVEADLVLRPEFNDQYHAGELKKLITSYLSPWLNNDPVKLAFGGSVHRSSIINLLDKSEYVDYISDFKMIRLKSYESDMGAGIRGDEFSPEREAGILTSAGTHIINIERPC